MYVSPYLDNGALTINYSYFNGKEGYSIPITFVLREYAAPWDEKVEPLPPGQKEYETALQIEVDAFLRADRKHLSVR